MHPVLLVILVVEATKASSYSKYVDGYELTLVRSNKMWTDAANDCASRGGWIVQDDSTTTTNAIQSMMPTGSHVWLGALDQAEEGVWRWSHSGDILTYDRWGEGQPDNDDKPDENCLAGIQSWGYFYWNDYHCREHTLYYFCQDDPQISYYLGSYELHYYRYSSGYKKTFASAQSFCEDRNLRLVEILNSDIYYNIMSEIDKDYGSSIKFWTGGNDIEEEGHWWWNDITPVDYERWMSGRPSLGTKGNCMIMKYGGWIDYSCDETAYFICQRAQATKVSASVNSLTVEDNSTKVIECESYGIPVPVITWYDQFDNEVPSTRGAVYQKQAGIISQLLVNNATISEEGRYKCVSKQQSLRTVSAYLYVPTMPEIELIEAESCSANLHVTWKSHPRALGAYHRITVANSGSNESQWFTVRGEMIQTTVITNLFSSIPYDVQVKPCANSSNCLSQYAAVGYGTTGGVPNPVSYVFVSFTNSSSCTCNVSWSWPYTTPREVIEGYTLSFLTQDMDDTSSNVETEIIETGTVHFYSFSMRSRGNYSVGVAARTCAGVGKTVFAQDECVCIKFPDTGLDKKTILLILVASAILLIVVAVICICRRCRSASRSKKATASHCRFPNNVERSLPKAPCEVFPNQNATVETYQSAYAMYAEIEDSESKIQKKDEEEYPSENVYYVSDANRNPRSGFHLPGVGIAGIQTDDLAGAVYDESTYAKDSSYGENLNDGARLANKVRQKASHPPLPPPKRRTGPNIALSSYATNTICRGIEYSTAYGGYTKPDMKGGRRPVNALKPTRLKAAETTNIQRTVTDAGMYSRCEYGSGDQYTAAVPDYLVLDG